jgi:predicted kinase
VATVNATKTLIVLSGLPYSGKSTIAAQLGGIVLSRDEIVEALLADPVKQMIAKNLAEQISEPVSKARETKEANAMNDALTVLYVNEMVERIQASTSETIICDGTHLQRLSRAFIQQLPEYKKIAIVLKTSPEVCIDRLSKSTATGLRATVTPEMIQKLAEVTEWPTTEEGFDEVKEKSATLTT